MIFHTPDTSFARLKSLQKRCASFAKKYRKNKKHPLYVKWENCKLFLNAATIQDYKIANKADYDRAWGMELCYNMVLLDWFSLKLEEHSKVSMLKGDRTLAAILFEVKDYLIADFTKLQNGS